MDFSFSIVVTAVKTAQTVADFVTGGDLRAILSAVGDNELAAAKFALESSKIARNPREQVLLAVGHLQSAHTAYWQTIVKSKNSQFKKGARTFSYSATCLKEQWVCSLMQYVTFT